MDQDKSGGITAQEFVDGRHKPRFSVNKSTINYYSALRVLLNIIVGVEWGCLIQLL